MRYLVLLLLALVACDDIPTGTTTKIASQNGCDTFEVHVNGRHPTYYTKCDGRPSVASTSCHDERVNSKQTETVCDSHTTVEK